MNYEWHMSMHIFLTVKLLIVSSHCTYTWTIHPYS